MVAIMWLTGGKKPPLAPQPRLSPALLEAPEDVNETKIAALQSRIEELQRQQLVAESALAQQTRALGARSPGDRQTSVSSPTDPRSEDPVRAERNERAYAALFSSNVALSYRTGPRPTQGAQTAAADRAPAPLLPGDAQPRSTAPAREISPEAHNDSLETTPDGQGERQKPLARAAERTYVLFEGTILDTVLINRLDGQFAGPIECLVSTDVYANDRQHLLIPAGALLLGEARKVDAFGETRLAVVFHRLLMPDGYSVGLDQFRGLNQAGDTGLEDQVDNHYLRIFGVSLAIGALGAVAEGATSGALNASSSDLMRQGFAQSTAQSSAQILDKFLNLMPTVTIREGHRVKVYLAGDLALPDYNHHPSPSGL